MGIEYGTLADREDRRLIAVDTSREGQVEQVVVDEHLHLPDMFAITLRSIRARHARQYGAARRSGGRDRPSPSGMHRSKPLLKGEIVSVECDYDPTGARVLVRGYDSSHRLHRGRQTRTFLNVTDSEIVKRVARDAGHRRRRRSRRPNDSRPRRPRPTVSDWDFIRARASGDRLRASRRRGQAQLRASRPSLDGAGEGNPIRTDDTDPRR